MSKNSYPVTTEPAFQKNNQIEEESIDIKQFIVKAFHYWYYFVLSALICFFIAWLLGRYATPVWHVQAKIMVKDTKGSTGGSVGSLGADLGAAFNVRSSADNEIQILNTRSLMQKAVEDMQLNVRIFSSGRVKRSEIFEEAPFHVFIYYKADTLKAQSYEIRILEPNRFKISNDDQEFKQEASFNQRVQTPQFDFIIKPKAGRKMHGNYEISVESVDASVNKFAQLFKVQLSDKQATTIDLNLDYPHPKKGEVILDRIMHLYLLSNLQNEVIMADSAMAFINSRIAIVGKELNSIEREFEQYKSNNNLANIEEQSKSLVTSAREYYDRLNQQEVQLSVVRDLERYINRPDSKSMIPSSLSIPSVDPSFGQAINSYNNLVVSRDKALLSYTSDNPVVQNLDQQIESARQSILNSVRSYKTSLETAKNQLERQNADFKGQLKQVPSKERNYLDLSRQQNLKEQLYLYLLQKREETAISKTSTLSSSRVIDPAKSEFSPYKPNKLVFYLVALLLGLFLPALYLILRELFNIRITSKNDIEKGTTAPIVGEVGRNTEKYSLVTAKNSRSMISEQFRAIRTNLQFILNTEKSNVLLFTSSTSGEGKSFISLNIGAGLALAGKKVVLLEFDLRKPNLSQSINLDNSNGFSNYVSSPGDEMNLDKLLQPSGFHENAFLISSGPIPPNPAELLMSPKTEKLITALKQRFDYVIIDCAPIGLVTDALLLEKFADATLYIVRQNYTYKNQLSIVNDLQRNNKVKHLYLIVNDIKTEIGGYSSYTQGYGYGYGYGEVQKSSLIDMLKFWKR